MKVSFLLKAIVFFENGKSFSIAFKDITFQNFTKKGWAYFNSTNGLIQPYQNFKLDFSLFFKENRLPLLIIYKIEK